MPAKISNTRKCIIFISVIFGGLLLFGIYSFVRVGIFHAEYPVGDFRFLPWDRFKDFFTINFAVKGWNPYTSRLSNYPPLILVFAAFYSKLFGGNYWGREDHLAECINEPHFRLSLIVLMSLYVIAVVFICAVYMLKKNRDALSSGSKKDRIRLLILAVLTGVSFVVSAPSVFLIDRGNYLVVTIVLFFLWAICEKEDPEGYAGPVFLALCAATKVYPLYIFGIYVFTKRWKQLFVACTTGLVLTVASMVFFRESMFANFYFFVYDLIGYGGVEVRYASYFNVGLTGLTPFVQLVFGIRPDEDLSAKVWLIGGVVISLLGFICSVKEQKTWKKVLLISSMMVFLTPNSFLYNSCYILPAVLLMLADRDDMERRDFVYLLATALLLIPKSYAFLPAHPDFAATYNTVSWAVAADMLLYMTIIFYYCGSALCYNLKLFSKKKR